MDIEKLVDEFIEGLPCKADLPYPEAKVEGQNLRYAKLLMDAYSDGEKAEMTAIAQYMHHHLTIQNKEIANAELCIALIEMKHLELLGDLIKNLGGNPKYRNSNKSWWDGGQVGYGDSTEFKLKLDIEAEKAAIEGYKTLISEIKDKHVVHVLQRILEDEIVHLNILNALFKKYFDNKN
ncbi:MAG: bacterioferritin [Clostridia bacterium]|jgi:bacterioferritin|nr:bacterioferritin [Clostridia bacterium]